MLQRGRPTRVDLMIKRLRGSAVAKERVLAAILNLGGGLSAGEACRSTRMSRTGFRKQRVSLLKASLEALEPRPRGRPRRERPRHLAKIEKLLRRIAELEEDLAFAGLREEMARVVPLVPSVKKTRRASDSR